MGKLNFDKIQQAMKRKRLDDALEARKKISGDASAMTSLERTLTTESNRSLQPVKVLVPEPSRPSRSFEIAQSILPISM